MTKQHHQNGKPPPISTFVREFNFPGSDRRIAVDRRAIAFVCEDKDRDSVCVIAFKTQAKACPVVASYRDVLAWWRGEPVKAAAPEKPANDPPPVKPNGKWHPPRPKKASKKLTPQEQTSRAAALAANQAVKGA